MATKYVDPISRIEGHLGVKLTTTGNYISEADVHGNLWRGFENFLIGREPNDAITFTQRICGVCPVPHGQASTYTVEAAIGYNDMFQTFSTATDPKGVPPKALHVRNLVLGAEFLMSSLTHFYHLAAPSYIQGPNIPPWTPYFADSFYHPYLLSAGKGTGDLATGNGGAYAGGTMPADDAGFSKDLWSAVIKQYVKALRIRRLTFEAGALFAGRMPMTSALIAGGTGIAKGEVLTEKCDQYKTLISEVGTFIVKEYVPVVLALGALYPNYDNNANATTLEGAYPALWAAGNKDNTGPVSAANTGWGAGVGNFLAWGGFPTVTGTLAMGRGYKIGAAGVIGIGVADVKANLREHILHSRYSADQANNNLGTPNAAGVTDPFSETRTHPVRDDSTKYSWLKAPRWNGSPMEVGPMARCYVGGIFVNGSTLASTVPGYGGYVKTAAGNTGLDPAMIGADLAVALVRAGLAEVWVGATHYDAAAITGANNATLASVYDNANAVIMGAVRDWVVLLKAGLSTMDRLRGRALESLVLVQALIGAPTKGATGLAPMTWAGTGWVNALKALPASDPTYRHLAVPTTAKFGFGATEAPRGALMHAVHIDGGKITAYQCIVPTTWNGSPKDAAGVRGPMEQAMVGAAYNTNLSSFVKQAGGTQTTETGIEALRIAQSFDPCIACAVH